MKMIASLNRIDRELFIALILTLMFCTGCADNRHESMPQSDQSVPTDATGPSDSSPAEARDGKSRAEWCSLDILKNTENRLGQLDAETLLQFLTTFHKPCKSNTEYSEWANELLFGIIQRQPVLLIQVLAEHPDLEEDYILMELATPVHDSVDLDLILKNLKALDVPNDKNWKQRLIFSIENAMGKFW